MQNLDLQAVGSIDVSGKGYVGGEKYQNGYGPSPGLFFAPAFNRYYGASGGGNGGDGGNSTDSDGGVASCDISFPSNLGSSGGGADQGIGGDGGGLIFLNVNGTATLNGAINLNGGNGNILNQSFGVSGGGAGGSFYLNTNSVAGSPSSFSATGGDGSYANAATIQRASGSGGGGCVKILYTNSVSIAESDVDVDGGITEGVDSQTNPSFWYGGLGQVQITQNVAGSVPEFSTYIYMLTLLSALTIMYYFGRAKKLTV